MSNLILNNEVSAAEGAAFKALKSGLYVARVISVQVREEKKYKSEEMEERLAFTFDLIREATGGSIQDIEGEVFNPLTRRMWKSFNKKARYSWQGKIELTNLGKLLEAVGFDMAAKDIDVSQTIGKILVLTVETKPRATDPSIMKNTVSDVSRFNGDLAEIQRIVDENEKDASSDDDLPFSKKKD